MPKVRAPGVQAAWPALTRPATEAETAATLSDELLADAEGVARARALAVR